MRHKENESLKAELWRRDDMWNEVFVVANQIKEHQTPTASGRPAWFGPVGYGTESHPLRKAQLGVHLYDGVSGIALFFAALAHARDDGEFRKLSLQTIAPLRQVLAEVVADPERSGCLNLLLGGLLGIGSLIYSFLKIGTLIGDPQLIREAFDITNLITRERVERDEMVRIQTGSAGAVLALLAMHEEMPKDNDNGVTPLEIAIICGRHLIEKRVPFDGLPRAWPLSPGKPPLGGFSYGAAGISYALLKLFERSHEPQFWDAAQEGLAFLRCLYSPNHKSWQNMRLRFQSSYRLRNGTWKDWWASGSTDQLEPLSPQETHEVGESFSAEERFLDIWCHGAAGIALSKIGALHINDSPDIRSEITDTLDRMTTFAQCEGLDDSKADDICCGYGGEVEVLNYAHQKLKSRMYLTSARKLAYKMWRRAQRNGRYNLSAARGTDIFAPSLFQGLAGVGYTMLRLLDPERLPCILLLE